MLEHIYSSFNKAIQDLWATVAPGKAILFGEVLPPAEMHPDTLQVWDLTIGGSPTRSDGYEATWQLSIWVGGNNKRQALVYADAIEAATGLAGMQGCGVLGVFDYSQDEPLQVGEAELYSVESSWIHVPESSPGLIHLARTIHMRSFKGLR